jgi:SapC
MDVMLPLHDQQGVPSMHPTASNPDSNGRLPQFIAISRERYAGKKWRHLSSYGFAAASTIVPVVGAEVARAALAMPLAFVQEARRFVLVALLSPTPGRNMLVGSDGRWLGTYIPARFRCYPFALFSKQGADKAVPCIDANSGLVVGSDSAGENFFDQDGSISPALRKVFDFLREVERSHRSTDVAVSALAEAGLIQSWPIKVKTGGPDQVIDGLYRTDEVALTRLSDDVFLKLRKANALPIAYAQMLSTGQIGIFEKLAHLQAKRERQTAALPESLDPLFGISSDDTIKFSDS